MLTERSSLGSLPWFSNASICIFKEGGAATGVVGDDADDKDEVGLAGKTILTALGASGGTILGEDDLPLHAERATASTVKSSGPDAQFISFFAPCRRMHLRCSLLTSIATGKASNTTGARSVVFHIAFGSFARVGCHGFNPT